jgi:hypothetical protein
MPSLLHSRRVQRTDNPCPKDKTFIGTLAFVLGSTGCRADRRYRRQVCNIAVLV